ncbi:MAG: phytoene desaturase family protein [Planctomycetota bacterium]
MVKSRIGIIGAGPGGLTAAMILARRGLDVTVFEQKDTVGGRNAPIRLGDFTFDTGPTFLMMKFILEEVFAEAGRRVDDYVDVVQLDPLYRLRIGGVDLFPSADAEQTKVQIREHFPGNEDGVDRFMATEAKRFDRLMPCLQRSYDNLLAYLNPIFLRALPRMSLGRSIFQNLGRYFSDDDLKLCFAFQSKYLGMSPWTCPAFFTMLSYIEHAYGIYHVMGGLNQISRAMAKVVEEEGGTIRLGTRVAGLILDGRRATGVRLDDGTEETFDRIVINADFGDAMGALVPPGVLRKYTPKKLDRWKLSCSTFMLYLGVDRVYDEHPHHNILFADDYRRNVEEITDDMVLSADPSLYVQNASVTDGSLAPAGKSTIYVLVPCPNTRSGIDWDGLADDYAEKVLGIIETRGGFTGLRDHIEERKVITPATWRRDYNIFEGATFNLAHTMGQVLFFRPHNRFEEIGGCYLVGGGTHPGSGLPTIYESGRISANLLCRDLGMTPSPVISVRPDGVG